MTTMEPSDAVDIEGGEEVRGGWLAFGVGVGFGNEPAPSESAVDVRSGTKLC